MFCGRSLIDDQTSLAKLGRPSALARKLVTESLRLGDSFFDAFPMAICRSFANLRTENNPSARSTAGIATENKRRAIGLIRHPARKRLSQFAHLPFAEKCELFAALLPRVITTSRLNANSDKKMANRTCAVHVAVPASPVNPNAAATMVSSKKTKVQYGMLDSATVKPMTNLD